MAVATKKRPETENTEPERDLRAEAMAAAEEQLAADRKAVKGVLAALGRNITDRKSRETCRLLVELSWLEHRITQTETMNSPLWCIGCATDGSGPAQYPGNPWMVYECLDHAEEMLGRSAKSWYRSLFGGAK